MYGSLIVHVSLCTRVRTNNCYTLLTFLKEFHSFQGVQSFVAFIIFYSFMLTRFYCIFLLLSYTMILEVNLFAFTYRLFHEDFSSIIYLVVNLDLLVFSKCFGAGLWAFSTFKYRVKRVTNS